MGAPYKMSPDVLMSLDEHQSEQSRPQERLVNWLTEIPSSQPQPEQLEQEPCSRCSRDGLKDV